MAIVSKKVRVVKVVKTRTVRVEKTVTVRKARPKAIVVTLPDVPAIPEPLRGTQYVVKRILTDGEDNPKLAKSNAADTPYRTWGVTFAPAMQSGHQMCSSASPGCRAVCLHEQGHARVFPSIRVSRIAKTVAFMQQRKAFFSMLRAELAAAVRLGERKGFTPAVRLNVLSDLHWERIAPWLFTEFPTVQFYDYTKHHERMLRWCEGKLPRNYHLTFSRSETNHEDCLRVLAAGGNVAVVFSSKRQPVIWEGHTVVNGDETDLRFADPRGVVVGLYAKGTAAWDESGFVVPVRE